MPRLATTRAAAVALFLLLSTASFASAFVPATTPLFSFSTRRPTTNTNTVMMSSYQEQFARAMAEKAARQAGGGYMPPPQAPQQQQQQQQYMYQQAPPPQQQPQQQAPVRPPPSAPQQKSALPHETNQAVATLLALLGERLGSGQPLDVDKIRIFSQAAEAVIHEARGNTGGVSYTSPAPQQQQPQQLRAPSPPPSPPVQQQQYYQQQQQFQQQQFQQQQQQQQQQSNEGRPAFVAVGFEQDEDIPWHLGSRTLAGPGEGLMAASAYETTIKGGFDEEGDDFETYGLPQPVERQKKSPFMETLKGTPFYVDIEQKPVTTDEYLRIIQERVRESQQARRQQEQFYGIQAADQYKEELDRRKKEIIRQQMAEQQQQQQQGGGQQYYS